MKREISLPIAWYPTKTAPSHCITLKFWQVLDKVEEYGINVNAVICDGVSLNRKFLENIATTKWNDIEGYYARNPFWDDENRTILILIDPSHLIKVSNPFIILINPTLDGGAVLARRSVLQMG